MSYIVKLTRGSARRKTLYHRLRSLQHIKHKKLMTVDIFTLDMCFIYIFLLFESFLFSGTTMC